MQEQIEVKRIQLEANYLIEKAIEELTNAK